MTGPVGTVGDTAPMGRNAVAGIVFPVKLKCVDIAVF